LPGDGLDGLDRRAVAGIEEGFHGANAVQHGGVIPIAKLLAMNGKERPVSCFATYMAVCR
jgi:hypothetical protein